MTEIAEATAPASHLFGTPTEEEYFSALPDPEGADRAVLRRIADKIGRTRRPGAKSDIPAGVTYFTQFVVHDLDFPTRDVARDGSLLDLGLIYGDGPKHDAFCYQVPLAPGSCRHLLRVGRARPTPSSPAWGAARDLARTSCPNLDARPVETRSEVLVPNTFSDSNMLLGQAQMLWVLMHNAIAGTLVETRAPEVAFELARRINGAIYRDLIRQEVLGHWLMPGLRERYTAETPKRIGPAIHRTPREFMAGVGRMGHGLVREIYSLNDQMEVMGLRNIIRHTSTGRPHDMPLTEDWLVDFSRFFAIGTSVPQRARALGPHVARPFATGMGVGADESADGLVLRDLIACTRGGLRSVRSLIDRASRAEPRLFEGCFAQDETTWGPVLAGWLADTGLTPGEVARVAADPPLTLFLMLEAEADTDGRTLGGLGSVIMGETLTAALPTVERDKAFADAAAVVFRDGIPGTMAEMVCFLQRHYRFAEGARLHSSADDASDAAAPSHKHPVGISMLDIHAAAKPAISRIEVADYIEMGRLVAQWATEPSSQPGDVEELKKQLEGIAVVPDRIRSIEFVQSTLDHLVLRLPVKEMIEESLERMSDPMGDGRYPLPQFYADFYKPGFGPVMTPLDTLLARVGDYTIAQCR